MPTASDYEGASRKDQEAYDREQRMLERIRTTYDAKPIPNRDFDWLAIDDATYDGQPGSPIGHGATEAEAIADLLEQIEEAQ